MSKKPLVLKVVTSGDGGVGKTTLLHRYVEGKFLTDTKMTIGVEFFLKELNFPRRDVILQLWDFGGQGRFRFLLQSYAKGAKGALLMFDLTRPITLMNIDEWVNICRAENPELPILFIGTKFDLKDEISVDDENIIQMKKQYNFIDYVKISSKTGYNVQYCFEYLAKQILKKLNKL